MEKNEKVDFILEQIRLCLAKKDYIRAQIISKKISVKFFENNNEPVRLDLYTVNSKRKGSPLQTFHYKL